MNEEMYFEAFYPGQKFARVSHGPRPYRRL
jgi:hypothetical protein